MAIGGAIFDCDGTLVDSMGMWSSVFDWLARRYGATVSRELYERIEPLSVRDECGVLHDELGIGASTDALYEELLAHVREEYRRLPLFDDVRRFLDELAAAGVPMIVASSTPQREVRFALEQHGLMDYFVDVISTEDVGGRDKEFPDVYLEALRRLGTPLATTWVFEDAPFGVRTPREAGFHVCGLFNDHDDRREEDIRPWCDIFAHGYPELSYALLADYERSASGEKRGVLQALIVGGSPCPSSPELVARLAAEADYVVCADAGAAACRAAGVSPDVFCGDEDSALSEDVAWASAAATHIKVTSEKYATDLALAIDCAAHEAARRGCDLALTVTCASGGRPDHALAVMGLVIGAPAASARVVEDGYEMRVLSPAGQSAWQMGEGAQGKTFSAIAVAPGTRVTLTGMKWSLEGYALAPLVEDRAISNVITSPDACAACDAGTLLAFVLHADN